MGTRNSTLIKVNGEYKVAQYGQWDGMPSGRGKSILKLLRTADLEKLKNRVTGLVKGEANEKSKEWKDVLKADEFDYTDEARKISYEEKFARKLKNPGFRFHRDCGGDGIIRMLLDDTLKFKDVALGVNFVADSLFCEWAYVIDLDANTLEVFSGFNMTPLTDDDRFHVLQENGKLEYYPCRLVISLPLDNLPTDDEFVALAEPEEESAPDPVGV